MLPAANRLRRAADFTDTARRGARATRGPVTAVVALAPVDGNGQSSPTSPRVGLVVGRRVGGSVVRHRVARRLRAAASSVLTQLPPGSTAVLRVHPGAGSDPALAGLAADALVAAASAAARRQR